MAKQEFTAKELENEIWKSVPGYAGIYQVSNLGRIRRTAPRSDGSLPLARILKPLPTPRGYLMFHPCYGGKQRRRLYIHRVVAEVFIGPADGLTVNHIDTNKANNRDSNLEYLTKAANHQHGHLNGCTAKGSELPQHKLTEAEVLAVRADRSSTQRALALSYGVSQSAIGNVKSRKSWKHI